MIIFNDGCIFFAQQRRGNHKIGGGTIAGDGNVVIAFSTNLPVVPVQIKLWESSTAKFHSTHSIKSFLRLSCATSATFFIFSIVSKLVARRTPAPVVGQQSRGVRFCGHRRDTPMERLRCWRSNSPRHPHAAKVYGAAQPSGWIRHGVI